MYMYMYMYMYTIGQAEVKLWEKNDWYIEFFHFSGLCNMLFECLLKKKKKKGQGLLFCWKFQTEIHTN